MRERAIPRIFDLLDVVATAVLTFAFARTSEPADLTQRMFVAVISVGIIGWAIRALAVRIGLGRMVPNWPDRPPATWTDEESDYVQVAATMAPISHEGLLVAGAVLGAMATGTVAWWAPLGLLVPAAWEWHKWRLRSTAHQRAVASRHPMDVPS